MGWRERLAALLSVSAYQPPPLDLPSLDDATVERVRRALGGNIVQLPQTKTRWYIADLETAMHSADAGDPSTAAQLCRSLRRDGVVAGLLSTSAGGLVRLPKRFTGRADIIERLERRDGTRPQFEEMVPPGELETFAGDAQLLGVAVGELMPVEGRDYPVFVRLDPEWLKYRWNEGRWYYQSIAGLLPITPGDGRWVLYTQNRIAPWQQGLWHALGRAWIHKEHALLHRANWEAKLANPARAAYAPAAANEVQRAGFLQKVIAWGINTAFELPPGWDVKIIESNGRGHESFDNTIEWANTEFMIGITGQVVTTTGGTGFANADVHKSIRADLIKARADAIAHCINTQILPAYTVDNFGIEALDESPVIDFDTTPPKELKVEADAMQALGQALSQLIPALRDMGEAIDSQELARRFYLPLKSQTSAPDTLDAGGEQAEPDAEIDEEDPPPEFDPIEALQ